jgi:hypothetical protein
LRVAQKFFRKIFFSAKISRKKSPGPQKNTFIASFIHDFSKNLQKKKKNSWNLQITAISVPKICFCGFSPILPGVKIRVLLRSPGVSPVKSGVGGSLKGWAFLDPPTPHPPPPTPHPPHHPGRHRSPFSPQNALLRNGFFGELAHTFRERNFGGNSGGRAGGISGLGFRDGFFGGPSPSPGPFSSFLFPCGGQRSVRGRIKRHS